MDSHERRSRQSNVPGFGGQAQHHQQHNAHAHSASTSNQADHRYRQHAHQHSQTTVPSGAGRGAAAAAAAASAYPTQYSYQVPDLQAGSSSLQYQTDQHPAQQPAQAQQQQQHSHQTGNQAQQSGQVQTAYHNMYYQQPLAQQAGTPPSPYDSYAAAGRQNTGIDVLANEMVPPNYYVGQAEAPTSAPNAASMAQGVNVQQYANPAIAYATTAAAQQSPSTGRGTGDSLAGYGTAQGMTDPSATGAAAQATYGQPGYNPAAAVAAAAAVQQNASLDSAYESYLEELRHVFVNVQNGDLREAGTSLLRISDWLLGNAESLGLVRDDESMHSERLKLWTDFNHCWLAVLQRQREMTLDWQQTGQRPATSTSMLEHDQMEAMGKELVRLCDVMEKHGLVDYQMGVWEEEIVHLLVQCLDLWESGIAPPSATGLPTKASSSSVRRR